MIKERGVWSATGMSAKQEAQRYSGQQEESCVEAGYMWHKAMRRSKEIGIEAEITSFCAGGAECRNHACQIAQYLPLNH